MRNDELKKVCQAYTELATSKSNGRYANLVLKLLALIIEDSPKVTYLQTLVGDEDEAVTLRKAQRTVAIEGGMEPWLYDLVQRVSG